MEFKLRPYQVDAIEAGVRCLTAKAHQPGIIVAPTASGKSWIIAGICHRLPGRCLVLQPQREILEQNAEKLRTYGFDPSIYSASCNRREVGQITLATIGSVWKVPELFNEFPYCIIDECHAVGSDGSMYQKFLSVISGMRVIGLSATPYRMASNRMGTVMRFLTRTRPGIFKKVIHYTQIKTLFDQGYLAPVEYKHVQTGFDPNKVRLNSKGSDYDDDSVRAHFKELHFSDQIVRCVERCRELGRGPVLVFTRFVEEADYVASRVRGCKVVSAKTPPRERAGVVAAFKIGQIPAVCNVGTLTTGYDHPSLANVILARPTMSLALYYQCCGRVLRTHPGKQSAFVIDMVGLVKQFGRIEDLVVGRDERGLWCVRNNERQLTNVYWCGK